MLGAQIAKKGIQDKVAFFQFSEAATAFKSQCVQLENYLLNQHKCIFFNLSTSICHLLFILDG